MIYVYCVWLWLIVFFTGAGGLMKYMAWHGWKRDSVDRNLNGKLILRYSKDLGNGQEGVWKFTIDDHGRMITP
jgi:hypothetical protein